MRRALKITMADRTSRISHIECATVFISSPHSRPLPAIAHQISVAVLLSPRCPGSMAKHGQGDAATLPKMGAHQKNRFDALVTATAACTSAPLSISSRMTLARSLRVVTRPLGVSGTLT